MITWISLWSSLYGGIFSANLWLAKDIVICISICRHFSVLSQYLYQRYISRPNQQCVHRRLAGGKSISLPAILYAIWLIFVREGLGFVGISFHSRKTSLVGFWLGKKLASPGECFSTYTWEEDLKLVAPTLTWLKAADFQRSCIF